MKKMEYISLVLIGIFACNASRAERIAAKESDQIASVLSQVVEKYNKNRKIEIVLKDLDRHFFRSSDRQFFRQYVATNKIVELPEMKLEGRVLSYKIKNKVVAKLELVELYPAQYRLNDYPLDRSRMTSLKEEVSYLERILEMRPLKSEARFNPFFEEAFASEVGVLRTAAVAIGWTKAYVDEDKPGGAEAISFFESLEEWEKKTFGTRSNSSQTVVALQCSGDEVILTAVTPDHLGLDKEEVTYRFPLITGSRGVMGEIGVAFKSQDSMSSCEDITEAKSEPCQWRTIISTDQLFKPSMYTSHFDTLLSDGNQEDKHEKYFGRILPMNVLQAARSCCFRDIKDSARCASIVADNRGDKTQQLAADPSKANVKATGAK